MSAGKYDIVVEQFATLRRTATWKDGTGQPVNLSGYGARMQVRSDYQTDDVVLELSTDNGSIALGGTTGTITFIITPLQSAGIKAGLYVYDLLLIAPNGDTVRLLEGSLKVRAGVTR